MRDWREKIYECGPLRYSLIGVAFTTCLLLLGFFCSTFSIAVVGSVLPLRLKQLGASDVVMAFLLNTIAGIFNMTVCPAVSFKSDRHRGKRWGRRCFYIIGSLPFVSICMLCFAASGPAGNFLSRCLAPWWSVSPATLTICVIGVIMVFYQFFRMFTGSVIYYLYNDIIPPQFLARVVGAVNIALTAAGAIFNFFLFQYSLSHFSLLLVCGTIVYTVGLSVMCFFLKEPKLPPLSEEETKKSRGSAGIATFMKESFSHPFYRQNFLAGSFWSAGCSIGTFLVFFYTNMSLSLEQIGQMNGISGMAGVGLGMIAATVGAVLVDKWHPVRVYSLGFAIQLLFPLVCCKWLFFSPESGLFYQIFLAENIIAVAMSQMCAVAGLPALMRFFPKSRFGQFCSAQAMLRSVICMVLGLVLGLAIDLGRKYGGLGENVYRYLWGWRSFWCVLGVLFYLLAYRTWIRLGGDNHYRAPAPWSPEKWEDLPNPPCAGSSRQAMNWSLRSWDAVVLLYLAGALGLAGYSFRTGNAAGLRSALILALPASLAAGAAWGWLRRQLMRILPGSGEETCRAGLHHGILLIAAFQQVLLLGAAVWQALLVTRGDAGLSARLWAFESLMELVTILLLWIGHRLELSNTR